MNISTANYPTSLPLNIHPQTTNTSQHGLLNNQCRRITKKQQRLIYCDLSCVNFCVTHDKTTATQNTLGYFRIYQVVDKTGRYDSPPLTCQRLHSWIYTRIADMLSIRLKRYGPHHLIKVLVADILPSTGAPTHARNPAATASFPPFTQSILLDYHPLEPTGQFSGSTFPSA